MYHLRKVLYGIWLIGFLFLCVLAGTQYTLASNEEEVSFVLILDSSETMNNSDAQNLHISAAKMFVDMLPSEKAKLCVIAFGPNYGDEAYSLDVPQNDGYPWGDQKDNHDVRIKVYYPLSSVADLDSKQLAKAKIDETLDLSKYPEKDTLSPVGYALRAAYEILEAGNTSDGQAAIILLSDGRVQGQADHYNEKNDYQSIDEYSEKCGDHHWPIYAMELDEDNVNDTASSGYGKIARHEMRDVIPTRSGGEHFELEKATQAQEKFSNVFSSFFEIEPMIDNQTIVNGEASFHFSVDEMVAETTITLTGDEIDKVEDIELVAPDGSIETFDSSEKLIATGAREVIFEKRYSVLKMMVPQDGEWTINVHGADGIDIGMFAVSIREMNVELSESSGLNEEEPLEKGTEASFVLKYIYHDTPYESENVYKKVPAKLVVRCLDDETTEEYDMVPGKGGYTFNYIFDKTGTYEVSGYVFDDHFEEKNKNSGVLRFQVDNLPVTPVGNLSDCNLYVNESADVSCTEYFQSPDGDPIEFACDQLSEGDISCEIDISGNLSISAGDLSGDYDIVVKASDGYQEEPAKQTVHIHILNHPLKFVSGIAEDPDAEFIEKTIRLTIPGSNAPGFLLKMADVSEESSWTAVFKEYFEDEDDTSFDKVNIVYQVEGNDDGSILVNDENEGELTFTPANEGSITYRVTATDPNDFTIQKSLIIHLFAVKAWGAIWHKFMIPIIAIIIGIVLLIVLLLLCFAGRKIYGVWDVTSGRHYEPNRRLGMTKSGRRSRCRVDNLLNDLEIEGGYGNVEIRVGNNFNRKVFFCNLGSLDAVIFNGTELQQPKKISVGKNQNIILVKGGMSVTFERH